MLIKCKPAMLRPNMKTIYVTYNLQTMCLSPTKKVLPAIKLVIKNKDLQFPFVILTIHYLRWRINAAYWARGITKTLLFTLIKKTNEKQSRKKSIKKKDKWTFKTITFVKLNCYTFNSTNLRQMVKHSRPTTTITRYVFYFIFSSQHNFYFSYCTHHINVRDKQNLINFFRVAQNLPNDRMVLKLFVFITGLMQVENRSRLIIGYFNYFVYLSLCTLIQLHKQLHINTNNIIIPLIFIFIPFRLIILFLKNQQITLTNTLKWGQGSKVFNELIVLIIAEDSSMVYSGNSFTVKLYRTLVKYFFKWNS